MSRLLLRFVPASAPFLLTLASAVPAQAPIRLPADGVAGAPGARAATAFAPLAPRPVPRVASTLPPRVLSLDAAHPVADAGPAAVAAPGPAAALDCLRSASPFDVTAPTTDVRVVGVASVDYAAAGGGRARKWFFSGAAGGAGAQRVYVFDGDITNMPSIPGTRAIAAAPGMVSALWGHRDGEGYIYTDSVTQEEKAVCLFGDEGRNLHILDAKTEAWIGNVNLAAFGAATTRAIGIVPRNLPNRDENIRVYVCDFQNGIEEWDLDLRTLAVARTARPVIQNPGAAYGIAAFWFGTTPYIAVFGQTQHACAGVGLARVTVYSLSPATYGNAVWSRSGDVQIPGNAPNLAGGLAGGAVTAFVNGQFTLCVLHQGVADTLGFVPMMGFGFNGPLDCTAIRLVVNGAPASGYPSGFSLLGMQAGDLAVTFLGPAPAAGLPLPLNLACKLDTFPILAQFFMPPPAGGTSTIAFPIAPWVVGNLTADAFLFRAGMWTSTERIDMNICPRGW